MRKIWLPLVIALIFAVSVAIWFFRWEIVPLPRGDGLGTAYAVDRLTGDIYFLLAYNKTLVVLEKP